MNFSLSLLFINLRYRFVNLFQNFKILFGSISYHHKVVLKYCQNYIYFHLIITIYYLNRT